MRGPVSVVVPIAALLIAASQGNAAEPDYPREFDWGHLTVTDTSVDLTVQQIPQNRIIRLPRFNNPYRRIHLQHDDRKKSLPFRPGVSDWMITLPETAAAPVTVVIETVGPPQLLSEPFVITADEQGSLVLPAHHAVVHGRLLRYEPQPIKNTVGYWADEEDWCEWKLSVPAAGRYDVHVLQGCGKGHGGSEVEVQTGDSSLTFVVEDTGHFQKFKDRHVGTLTISQGAQSLSVTPLTKANGAVMDVRQIRLVPVED